MKKLIFPAVLVALFAFLSVFGFYTRAAKPGSSEVQQFEIAQGAGLSAVADELGNRGLIRSPFIFKIYAALAGSGRKILPGIYQISPASSTQAILDEIAVGQNVVRVVIPEGVSSYEIDDILAKNNVLKKGEFLATIKTMNSIVEGRLFPDTYDFYIHSKPQDVIDRMTDNFNEKALPILNQDQEHANENLILASLLEREVSDQHDRQIVAGILERRLALKMPLQVDYSICYSKDVAAGKDVQCYPLTSIDFSIEVPYNTYLHRGLPPGPISNPGISAIKAAMEPIKSKYLFYLSDPSTKRTIFSETLQEHAKNRNLYLK